MELQELTNKVLRLFDAKTTEDLPEKLLAAVQNNDETVYEKFCENVKDLSIDWLQMIFQYYLPSQGRYKGFPVTYKVTGKKYWE